MEYVSLSCINVFEFYSVSVPIQIIQLIHTFATHSISPLRILMFLGAP